MNPEKAIGLQARWHTLYDPDRAEAILPIIRTGMSRRELGRRLHCSEALIRRLLRCLDADPADLDLARRLQISTRELERRAIRAANRREAIEALERDRSFRVSTCTRAILSWRACDSALTRNAAEILEEAGISLLKEVEPAEDPFIGRAAVPTDVASQAAELVTCLGFAFPEWAVRWQVLVEVFRAVSSASRTSNV